jgi:hypothetical protein
LHSFYMAKPCTFHVPIVKSVFLVCLGRCLHCVPRLTVRYRNNSFFFCRVRLLSPHTTPNMENQGIPLRLGHHLPPVQQRWHYQYLMLPLA